MHLFQIPVGQMENFAYIIADEKTKLCAIVDPGWEIHNILKIVEKNSLKVNKILLTHTHFDHILGVKDLTKITSAKIYVHELEADEVEADEKLIVKIKDGDEIEIGDLIVKVIHTPGHTKGAVCFLVGNKLLTGDTLFVEAIGRTDLPGGNPEQLFESLQKIKKLTDDIEIYPGHDYGSVKSSTVKYEKENNPYMR